MSIQPGYFSLEARKRTETLLYLPPLAGHDPYQGTASAVPNQAEEKIGFRRWAWFGTLGDWRYFSQLSSYRWLTTFCSLGDLLNSISVTSSSAPTTMALSARLKAGQ